MYYFRFYMISIFLVLLFSIYQSISILIKEGGTILTKLFAIVIFAISVYLAVRRNTYLPFLGPSVIPSNLIKDSVENKGAVKTTLALDMPDGTKVLYWASNPSKKEYENPYEAYAGYNNIGIATVKNKSVIFQLECPGSYHVGFNELQPHLHYRILHPSGFAGSVKTLFVKC